MTKPNAMSLSRREFLQRGGVALVAASCLGALPATTWASGGSEPDEDGVGILVDITRCQGCQSCALACKRANELPQADVAPSQLDNQTFSFVDERQVTMADGRTEIRHVKRQCMHCLDAACVSACPAAAMYKTESGPVSYRPNRCLGCRYCQLGCPFGVPQFDWNKGLTPEIRKCWMCLERQQAGEMPACVEACPTGAIRFGRRSELLQVAHARIASNPDRYIDHVYGEHEAGGTSVLYLSDVPFSQLGFPDELIGVVPREETEKIMTKLPYVIGGLAVALSGTAYYTHHHVADADHEEDSSC